MDVVNLTRREDGLVVSRMQTRALTKDLVTTTNEGLSRISHPLILAFYGYMLVTLNLRILEEDDDNQTNLLSECSILHSVTCSSMSNRHISLAPNTAPICAYYVRTLTVQAIYLQDLSMLHNMHSNYRVYPGLLKVFLKSNG